MTSSSKGSSELIFMTVYFVTPSHRFDIMDDKITKKFAEPYDIPYDLASQATTPMNTF